LQSAKKRKASSSIPDRLETSTDNRTAPAGGKKKKSNGQRQKWSVEENLA
jgi:hypothetical protein